MTVVTNAGNAVVWPSIYIHGPATVFTITNNSVLDDAGNPLTFAYDPTFIGPARFIPINDYAILDMFENRLTLASNGFDLASGIDMIVSDFFPLAPGANNLTTTGGVTVEVVRPVTAWA